MFMFMFVCLSETYFFIFYLCFFSIPTSSSASFFSFNKLKKNNINIFFQVFSTQRYKILYN